MSDKISTVVVARFLVGFSFIAVGVVAFIGSTGLIDTNWLLEKYWPVALLVLGVVIWLANHKRWIWTLIIIAFGVVALLNIHTDMYINIWALLLPAVAVAIGVSVIVRGARPSYDSIEEMSSDRSDQFALLSGSENRVTTQNYTGGKAVAILGGVEIDLREASIKKKAVLDIFVLMGGVEIKVPAGVRIISDIGAVLGGVEVKPDPKAGKNLPVLILTGTVVMGGVEVKY